MARTLLLVDDSSTMRRIVKRTVRMSGVDFDETFEAESAEQGFEILSTKKVDVVLCDVNMSGMTGVEMVRKARTELPQCENTIIVMVTTESSAAFVAEAVKAGADGYISKPFTPEDFAKKLKPLL